MGKTRTTQSKTVKFPTEAGAMLNVNCVTEVAQPALQLAMQPLRSKIGAIMVSKHCS